MHRDSRTAVREARHGQDTNVASSCLRFLLFLPSVFIRAYRRHPRLKSVLIAAAAVQVIRRCFEAHADR
jgi:hypothetical protein